MLSINLRIPLANLQRYIPIILKKFEIISTESHQSIIMTPMQLSRFNFNFRIPQRIRRKFSDPPSSCKNVPKTHKEALGRPKMPKDPQWQLQEHQLHYHLPCVPPHVLLLPLHFKTRFNILEKIFNER